MPKTFPVLDWSILLAALLGIFMGIKTRQTRLGKMAIVVGSINATISLVVAATITFQSAAQPPASAEIHYRVFELDAKLVDALIPAELRQEGVMPGVKPAIAEHKVTAVSKNGIFTWTDSQRQNAEHSESICRNAGRGRGRRF
jgi:hypothetical protein